MIGVGFASFIGTSTSRRPAFSISLARENVTDISGEFYQAGQPIAVGSWNFPSYGISYNNPGYLFFDVSTTDDISQVSEFGIVHADNAFPIYSDSPEIIPTPPLNAMTYSVPTSGSKYFKAYGLIGTEYTYSPYVEFLMQEINFNSYTVTPNGFMNYNAIINMSAVCVNPIGTVTGGGFHIVVTLNSETWETADPYWDGEGEITCSLEENLLGYSISIGHQIYDQYGDLKIWIRAYFIIDGEKWFSGLIEGNTY